MGNNKHSNSGINWFMIILMIGLGFAVWKVGK